jgi:hypothetical protein
MNRGSLSADTRAAFAALARPNPDRHFERYLVLEELDDGSDEIRTLVRERSPRFLEPVP